MSILIKPKLVQVLKRNQDDQLLVYVRILKAKYGGIVRDERESWESELLLVVSLYGRESYLDLSLDASQLAAQYYLQDNIEPGLAKYYLVRLPAQSQRRPLGPTNMISYWLNKAQSFDLYQDALKAFENA